MSKWRRFRRLNGTEQWLLLQGALVLLLATAALRCFGFRRVQRILTRLSPGKPVGSRQRQSAVLPIATANCHWYILAARMVQIAARHRPFRVGCLPSALTLWWLLRFQGIDSAIRVGVRRMATGIEAHAWVEYDGGILVDSGDAHEGYLGFDSALVPFEAACS